MGSCAVTTPLLVERFSPTGVQLGGARLDVVSRFKSVPDQESSRLLPEAEADSVGKPVSSSVTWVDHALALEGIS